MKKNNLLIPIILIVLFVIIIIIVFGHGGSSSKANIEPSKSCKLVSDQSASGYVVTTGYEIYSTDGIVDKVKQFEIVDSKDKNIIDFFKTQFNNQNKSTNEKYGGYTYIVLKLKNRVTNSITIDYSKFDMKKFANDNSGMEGYINKDNRLTLDGALKMYTSIGATCK